MSKKQNKSSGGKASVTKNSGKSVQKEAENQTTIPLRVITSAVCIALFILFLVIFLQPEGVIVRGILQPFIIGLIGNVSF